MMKAVLNNRMKRGSAERGIGLIEVLVALVIFALGVVGMAGLQLRTMSSTMDSTQRSYVISKTQDIADRIRSNGIPAKSYLGTYNENLDFCDTEVTIKCADNVAADVAACTVPAMVAFDMYDVFCAGDNELASDGSYEQQVAEWKVVVGCERPIAGVMTPTTECDGSADEVIIESSWFARSVDDGDLSAEPKRDSMILRFIP